MARILVIDDEKTFCSLCSQILAGAGHEVISTEDGFEGLNQFRADPTDAILVDLIMPHNGLQVIRVLRETHPTIPIIAMSGYGQRRLAMALELGANRMLDKPFTPEELIAAVDEVLPASAG